MTNPQKAKGSKAEREAAALLSSLTGYEVTRAYGAGRPEDVGDLAGLPDTVVQVKNYADINRAIREGLPAVEVQRRNARAELGVLMARRRGGSFVMVLTPEQYVSLWAKARRSA